MEGEPPSEPSSAFDRAVYLAKHRHETKPDKHGSGEYLDHAFRVMAVVDLLDLPNLDNTTLKIVALLHDLKGHGDVSVEELEKMGIPVLVIEALELLEGKEGQTREEKIVGTRKNDYATIVQLVDNRDNKIGKSLNPEHNRAEIEQQYDQELDLLIAGDTGLLRLVPIIETNLTAAYTY